MLEFFRGLFASDFMPHGTCYLWRSDVVWLHVISDSVIGLAYYSIPVTLWYFVRRRNDLAFHWIFLMFAAFIMACGSTHFMSIYTLWTPVYRMEGLVKLFTAAISGVTAAVLIPIVPKALALPRPGELAAANRALETEVAERRRAEEEVRRLNEELERRVRERTAELERSNEDLARFAYIASHDLQEPLRMVSSYTQLLARRYRGQLGPDADEFIQYAVDGAVRMQSLVTDLLAYSRLDGEAVPDSPVDTGAAAQEAIRNLEAAIGESGAEIEVGPLPTVPGERSQIVQVFQNLIGNAIKYRGQDRPLVRISATEEGNEYRFSVQDNGVGIDPKYHEQIFALFRRLHSRNHAGTGIGLAVCKKSVLRHGGRIWVDSSPGQGATFRFTLPKAAR